MNTRYALISIFFATSCLFSPLKAATVSGDRMPTDTGSGREAKAWTVLVYIAGDNNLAEAGIDDVNEMEKVGSGDDLNIVVQIDGSRQYSPSAPGTRRYYIVKDDDDNTIGSPVLDDLGEADMGSPDTLKDFLSWASERYPARHYAVILWNHGNGWYPDSALHRFAGAVTTSGPLNPLKAICSDEDSDSALTTSGVGDIFDEFSRRIGRRIDLVGFDACLMGMIETFYELRSSADYACASEKTEPGDGWPYDEWLAILAAHPEYDGERLGRAIVETYASSYSENGSQGSDNVTLSCVRLAPETVAGFEAAMQAFSREATRLADIDPDRIRATADETQDFRVRSFFGSYFTTHRDLYDFADRMRKAFSTDSELCSAAEALMEAINGEHGLVVANGITDVSPYGQVKDAHGLAVYLPVEGFEATYSTMDFPIRCNWLNFIDRLNKGKLIDNPKRYARPLGKQSIFNEFYAGQE